MNHPTEAEVDGVDTPLSLSTTERQYKLSSTSMASQYPHIRESQTKAIWLQKLWTGEPCVSTVIIELMQGDKRRVNCWRNEVMTDG